MNEPVVSVGIISTENIKFELYGDFRSFGFDEYFSGRFSVKIEDDIIIIDGDQGQFKISDEITFEPTDFNSESFLLREVIIGSSFHWEQKENLRFIGSLKLIRDNEKVCAVNILPVEAYLTSVISSEMNANSSLELLKAHSVISRSWLLAQIEKIRIHSQEKISNNYRTDEEFIKWYDKEDHVLFDVCADDHCQRYHGITRVYNDNAKLAAEITRGVVLIDNNKICDTRYSKSCGGITESFENVWEPVIHPYLTSIIDYKFEPESIDTDFSVEKNAEKWIRSNSPAFCNTRDTRVLSQVLQHYDQKTSDFYRWVVEYEQNEISAIIKDKTGIDFGEIIDLVPVERGNSSRLVKLKIVGSKKTLVVGKELEIRRVLSLTHLYSSAFVVYKVDIINGIPGKFIIFGAGWGHGVGLCQIGAAVMADLGYRFDEILLHYFKGAKLKKIY